LDYRDAFQSRIDRKQEKEGKEREREREREIGKASRKMGK